VRGAQRQDNPLFVIEVGIDGLVQLGEDTRALRQGTTRCDAWVSIACYAVTAERINALTSAASRRSSSTGMALSRASFS
jgi:hypothetical protein